jgi:hypothetical protein
MKTMQLLQEVLNMEQPFVAAMEAELAMRQKTALQMTK